MPARAKGQKMDQAKSGDQVKAHYTVKLDDGEVFQTSVGRKPLQFTIGDQQLIPAFEQALIGMAPGQSKTVVIAARDAFGEHRNDLIRTISREQIPDALAPQVGQRLRLSEEDSEEDGKEIMVTVISVSDEDVTLDANHPLAGEDLTFDIELVEIL